MTGKKKEAVVVENGLTEAVATIPEVERDFVLIVNGEDVTDKLVDGNPKEGIREYRRRRALLEGKRFMHYEVPDMGMVVISGKSQVVINTEKSHPWVLGGPKPEGEKNHLYVEDSEVELGGFYGISQITDSEVKIGFINSVTLSNVKSKFSVVELRSVVKSGLHDVTFTDWLNKNKEGLVIYKSNILRSKVSLKIDRITDSSISDSQIEIEGEIKNTTLNRTNIVFDKMNIGTESNDLCLYNNNVYAYRDSDWNPANKSEYASIWHPADILEYALGRFKFSMVPVRDFTVNIVGYVVAVGGTSRFVKGEEGRAPSFEDVAGCFRKHVYSDKNPGEDYLLDAFYDNVWDLIRSRMRVISLVSSIMK